MSMWVRGLDPPLSLALKPAGGRLYIRSYLRMRTLIGAVGLALPVILVVGDVFFVGGTPSARGSMSAYYHSGMRDLFVGALVVEGVFLAVYQVAQRDLENRLSTLAGSCALLVAFFPTGLPQHCEADPPVMDPTCGSGLTPLQQTLGEATVSCIHALAASTFILSLGVISVIYSRREGARQPRPGHRSPAFWRWVHLCCAAAIFLACAFIAFSNVVHVGSGRAVFVGEFVATLAFGASWLAKGLDLRILTGTPDESVHTLHEHSEVRA